MDEMTQKRLYDIEYGIYTFDEVYNKEEKEEIEKVLLEKFDKGTITDKGRRALLKYLATKLKSGKCTINDIPKQLQEALKIKSNNQ